MAKKKIRFWKIRTKKIPTKITLRTKNGNKVTLKATKIKKIDKRKDPKKEVEKKEK